MAGVPGADWDSSAELPRDVAAREPGSILSEASALFDNKWGGRLRHSGLKNAELIGEYLTDLRVEKGLRPLSCEAYGRDLLQFAEYLEGTQAVLETAQQREVAGFLEHLPPH